MKNKKISLLKIRNKQKNKIKIGRFFLKKTNKIKAITVRIFIKIKKDKQKRIASQENSKMFLITIPILYYYLTKTLSITQQHH